MHNLRLIATSVATLLVAAAHSGVCAAQPGFDPNLSPAQARGSFVDAGFRVEPLQTWDWLNPPTCTFQVRDLPRNRVLLVEVYENVAQAQRASERVVKGYSASTWLDNVAVFEASNDDHDHMMAALAARSQGMQLDPPGKFEAADLPVTEVEAEYTSVLFDAMQAAFATVTGSANSAPSKP